MGTWNATPFGNDAAMDWLWELKKASNDSILAAALRLTAKKEITVAAATVIEAARRQPVGKLPRDAKAWVTESGYVPSNALVLKAAAAVKRIMAKSELRDLWAETSSFNRWQREMESLLGKLQEVSRQPVPVRKPKQTPAPRQLAELIKKVMPDDVGPLREKLRARLEAITDLEAPCSGGVFPASPLTLLAAQGLLPEVRQLVERGARVNPLLVEQNSSTPLEAACRGGHAQVAGWLLEHGAEIYVERAQSVRLSAFKLEFRAIAAPTALFCAIKSGSIPTIEVLIQHGATLDTSETEAELRKLGLWHDTLLHKAVETSHADVVEFLVKSGLNLEGRDYSGSTPLLNAVNQTNNGDGRDTRKVVEILLRLGADPNAKDEHGYAALDLVSESTPEVARLIKKFGGRVGADTPDLRA